MKIKSVPLSLVFFCIVLGLLGVVGMIASLDSLARWKAGLDSGSLAIATTFATVFFVAPFAAIVGVMLRKYFALYLGLVPLLLVFGASLRLVTETFASHVAPTIFGLEIYSKMATVGFAIALATFILKLGFSKTVAAYFSSPDS